jgi:hypothetical protein
LGDSGDTIIIPAGATITNNGTATGFGRTGTVDWDTTPKTTTVTAVSGNGYFVNTTAGAITVNLPAGVAGSIVAVSDYANTAATNNIIIDPNGTDKINGLNENAAITTNGAAITLVYVDSTRGWKDINDATLNVTGIPPFIVATGGTITTSGDYKIHTFTGPGTFTVTNAGTPAGSDTVDYMVIAAGGGGGTSGYPNREGGGGGAGGYRESKATGAPWTASPLASSTSLPVSTTGYPITVGAGGNGSTGPGPGTNGNPSIFSTITSTGGGYGSVRIPPGGRCAASPGGSGGGGGNTPIPCSAGTGNTPPVSPPQGNPGGGAASSPENGAGGGGAGAAGNPGTPGGSGGGGPGTTSSINGTPTVRAGGGGGYGQSGYGPQTPGGGGFNGSAGTANTGGGGSAGGPGVTGGTGGSGLVIIRYKYQ